MDKIIQYRLPTCLVFGCIAIILSSQALGTEWGTWSYPTTTNYAQNNGFAMCYGLYEGTNGSIYVLEPVSNQNLLRRYDVNKDSWYNLPNLPKGPDSTLAWAGSNLCYYHSRDNYYSGNFIFCTKGNSTDEFWCYYINDRQWHRLDDIPGPITVGKGRSLATGDTGRVSYQPYVNVYLLKGVNGSAQQDTEFLVYRFVVPPPSPTANPLSGNWTYKKRLYHGYGADLTYQPSQKALYAFEGGGGTGNSANRFWKYDIATDNWTQLSPDTTGAYEGSALATWGVCGAETVPNVTVNTIYAFKGANMNDFDAYRIDLNRWDRNARDPRSSDVHGVSYGSDLACGQQRGSGFPYYGMFAIFGSALPGYTNSNVGYFWPAGDVSSGGEQTVSVNSFEQRLIQTSPNPASQKIIFKLPMSNNTNSSIEIFDNSGKLLNRISFPTGKEEVVWNLKTNDGKTVSSGVYFYMLKIENKTAFGKFIVQR